ncbi:MAG: hypothetical protein M0T79_00600 [Actinomycetota bacterium]|jgi:hypothetical protein|nr:hypothetical protein [Actinomycetota bacterium]
MRGSKEARAPVDLKSDMSAMVLTYATTWEGFVTAVMIGADPH